MSFDDDVFAGMHVSLFETFGIDATVQRGAGASVPVRIVVNRGQERIGEFGSTIGRIDTLDFLIAQWTPAQGDVVAWTDRLGAHSKQVETLIANDGFVATAVLHG